MNITALQNITPFSVNNTLINNSQDLTTNIVNNANSVSGGYFGLGILLITFFVLMIFLMTDQDVFRLDFLSSLVLSSGFCLVLGITLLVGDLISSYQHVMWFAILFMVAVVSKYYQRGG